ncbi:MAG: MAPEG family protein [Hyphomicrobiaceae bacterium]
MSVSQSLVFLPIFAQVFLTMSVLVALGLRRSSFLRHTGKGIQELALANDEDWDVACTKARKNFQSQFELPVLFYVFCLTAYALRQVDLLLLVLAGVFVVSRIGHSVIHLTSNIVARRAAYWFIGLFAVVGMWVILFVRVAATEF